MTTTIEELEQTIANETAVPELGLLNIEQLQQKIALLSQTESGQPLNNAMADLKKALLANPAACSLLLPEDVGAMVAKLRQITDKEILEANMPKKKDSKQQTIDLKKLDKATIDSITVDDLM